MEFYSRSSCESIPELKTDASLLGNIHQKPSQRHSRTLWLVKVTLHLSSLVIGILVGFALSRTRSGQMCDSHKFWRPSEFSKYPRKTSRKRRQNTTAAGPHNPLLIVAGAAREQLSGTWSDVLYDAQLEYDSAGTLVRIPSSPDYVGEPSAELEEAWEELLPGK